MQTATLESVARILIPLWIAVSSISCEDTSIWDTSNIRGVRSPECQTESDCEDWGPCRKKECTKEGVCVYTPLAHSDACNDNNVCTNDICNPEGECKHEMSSVITIASPNTCRVLSCKFGKPNQVDAPDGYGCEAPGIPRDSGYCYEGVCKIGIGKACESNQNNCYTNYCDKNDLCAFLPINDICNNDDQCGPGHTCFTHNPPGHCKIELNYPCDPQFPGDCETGFCSPDKICTKAPLGYPCEAAIQCLSNHCQIICK